MYEVFVKLFNMSIAAGWLVIAVMALRLLLKRAPKWLRCVLWGFVAVRLICPFTFESSFSLIPSAETINPAVVRYEQEPVIHSGIAILNNTVNPMISESFAAHTGDSVNSLHIGMWIAGLVWAIGMIAMLLYAWIRFIKIHKTVREAVPLYDNIWICDYVKSPFILGIVRPRIYLSSSMEEGERDYVMAHERAHLKRGDHCWKLLGYLLLAVYWFQPLVWAAYLLFCRDMELACDEKVIKGMNIEGKKAYANALVACSAQKKRIMACPIAFGEVGVKERVKTVLSYRKPAFWIILVSIVACVVVAACFLTNPISDHSDDENVKYAVRPMVMIDDNYYYDTGMDSAKADHSAGFDGDITSSVNVWEIPEENNQSNFGAGYGYQYGEDDTVEIYIDGKWRIFEYSSGDGSKIRYEDHWYDAADLSDDTIEWMCWYNNLSEMDKLAVSSIPSDLWELQRFGKGTPVEEADDIGENGTADAVETNGGADGMGTSNPVNIEDLLTDEEIARRREKKAITDAILEKNEASYANKYALACCDFVNLETTTETGDSAKDASHTVTYYGWALYEQYNYSEKGIEEVGGSHIPVALTFDVKEDGYQLKEYWEPRDGSYFVPDIRKKFPADIADDGIDSQKYIMQQKQSCYKQAVQFGGLVTEVIIEDLLDTICSGPAASSSPQDYMEAHSIEFRELLFYGEYTLRYCLNRFAQGKETGLSGKIMAMACEELLQTKGRLPVDAVDAETGQFWYDTLYAHAGNLVEPYLDAHGQ